jgi:hypothetical protein
MPSQGHGWGYRFLHPLLANFALIAVHGWVQFRSKISREVHVQFVGGLCVATILFAAISFPARMIQAYNINHPFVAASQYIRALETDIVLIDSKSVWFGHDFIRNDPLLRNRPKIMSVDHLDEKALSVLCANRDVLLIGLPELAKFSVHKMPRPREVEEARFQTLVARLKNSGCTPLAISKNG